MNKPELEALLEELDEALVKAFPGPEPMSVLVVGGACLLLQDVTTRPTEEDRKSTRLNSSHTVISYAVFCLKKKKKQKNTQNDRAIKRKHSKAPQRNVSTAGAR